MIDICVSFACTLLIYFCYSRLTLVKYALSLDNLYPDPLRKPHVGLFLIRMGKEQAFNYSSEEEHTLQAYNPSQFFKEYKGLLVQASPKRLYMKSD